MKRQIPGLSRATQIADDIPDGEYLVRVIRARYHWDKHKPYYVIRFEVLAPSNTIPPSFTGRVYCTVKSLWKLNWFLRDFGYDPELLGHDELDEKALSGLSGIVRVSNKTFDANSFLSLEGFAPAERWPELFGTADQEVA